jgi:hypothetical protein
VKIFDATEGIFFYYGKYLNTFYNSFKTGIIQETHVFRCYDYEGDNLYMKCQTQNGAETVLQPMIKRGDKRGDKRKQEMIDQELEPLVAPGQKPIKQV